MANTPELQPASLQVPAAGGKSTHQLINPTEDRLAFKVKSTNNDNYRVQPVYGIVEPCAQASIEVLRTEGSPKEDVLEILLTAMPLDAADPQEVFKNGAVLNYTIELPMSAE